MGEIDSVHEEVCGNKLELSGPLVDSYLRKLGESLKHKQTHSKATGLTNPLFIPWMVFRHIMTLARGYGCEVDVSAKGKKVEILIKKQASVRQKNILSFSILWAKLFTPEEIQKANGWEISLCWAIVCSCYKEYSHYTTLQ